MTGLSNRLSFAILIAVHVSSDSLASTRNIQKYARYVIGSAACLAAGSFIAWKIISSLHLLKSDHELFCDAQDCADFTAQEYEALFQLVKKFETKECTDFKLIIDFITNQYHNKLDSSSTLGRLFFPYKNYPLVWYAHIVFVRHSQIKNFIYAIEKRVSQKYSESSEEHTDLLNRLKRLAGLLSNFYSLLTRSHTYMHEKQLYTISTAVRN